MGPSERVRPARQRGTVFRFPTDQNVEYLVIRSVLRVIRSALRVIRPVLRFFVAIFLDGTFQFLLESACAENVANNNNTHVDFSRLS